VAVGFSWGASGRPTQAAIAAESSATATVLLCGFGADFDIARHSGADFDGAGHAGADLDGAGHAGADLDIARHAGTDFDIAGHAGADLDGTGHAGADFDAARHSGADLECSRRAGAAAAADWAWSLRSAGIMRPSIRRRSGSRPASCAVRRGLPAARARAPGR
jgi:uncharacterized protein YjbI with pentapeptide repeats